MSEWNSRLTIAAVLVAAVFVIGQRSHFEDRNFAIAANSESTPEVVETNPSGSPRILKFSLSLSSPKDLKVHQGDTVTAGEVLADRVEERSRLTIQRKSLDLAYQQIQQRVLLKPPVPLVPLVPPAVRSLPPVSYAEEEAQIQSASMAVAEAEKELQQQSEATKTIPLEESSAVDSARVKVENAQRLLENQKQKLQAVQLLKDLPPEVEIHEQEMLKRRESELQQATAEYQQASSKLTIAVNTRNEKLAQLATALQKARAEHQLAIAKLQTKKDTRAYAEYEASVTAARRAEEKNQAQQSYYRQLQDFQQQERDRSFQLAQLTSKIAEVDEKLSTISVVTSPYSGKVRRVKVVGQTNNSLSVELTLVVADGRDRSLPNSTTSTPSPQSPTSNSQSTKPFNTTGFTNNR